MNTDQPEWLTIVREKVETLRYGVVQIVIHDSRVTQIERTEKTRLPSPQPEAFDQPDKLEANNPFGTPHRTTG